jgi:ribosomal protein S18 acetylase RimI-like enzyme
LLLQAAEHQVAQNGFREAWLAVVASNTRARAFYTRAGWIDAGLFDYQAKVESRTIPVPAHRYIKCLSLEVDHEGTDK